MLDICPNPGDSLLIGFSEDRVLDCTVKFYGMEQVGRSDINIETLVVEVEGLGLQELRRNNIPHEDATNCGASRAWTTTPWSW